jgi:hypothetical protein
LQFACPGYASRAGESFAIKKMNLHFNRLALLFSLLLVACSEEKPTPTDSLTVAPLAISNPEVITIPSGTLLLQDDFTQAASGWDVFDESQAGAAYRAGEYQLRLKQTPRRAWGLVHAVVAPSNVTLSVAGRLVSGADSSGYGLLCRFTDAEHYYFFLVSGEGQFIIGKQRAGTSTGLSASAFQPSEAILPGNVPNLLTAQCVGDRLTLSVNGAPIAEVGDEEYREGQVGVLAAAVEGTGMEARFDDFAIYAP